MAKRIAGWPYFHKPKERQKQWKKNEETKKERYRSLLFLLKYFAANAANILETERYCR